MQALSPPSIKADGLVSLVRSFFLTLESQGSGLSSCFQWPTISDPYGLMVPSKDAGGLSS